MQDEQAEYELSTLHVGDCHDQQQQQEQMTLSSTHFAVSALVSIDSSMRAVCGQADTITISRIMTCDM